MGFPGVERVHRRGDGGKIENDQDPSQVEHLLRSGLFSGQRLRGRQLSHILPPVAYGQKLETPSEFVTVERDG
jgi:hypothetical protein